MSLILQIECRIDKFKFSNFDHSNKEKSNIHVNFSTKIIYNKETKILLVTLKWNSFFSGNCYFDDDSSQNY